MHVFCSDSSFVHSYSLCKWKFSSMRGPIGLNDCTCAWDSWGLFAPRSHILGVIQTLHTRRPICWLVTKSKHTNGIHEKTYNILGVFNCMHVLHASTVVLKHVPFCSDWHCVAVLENVSFWNTFQIGTIQTLSIEGRQCYENHCIWSTVALHYQKQMQ